MSINAPVLTGLSGVYGATWLDRWDINGAFTWDPADQTTGDHEIWIRRKFVDADFALWGTLIFPLRTFAIRHLCAASPDPIHYEVKLRFNNYTNPAGPFSNIVEVVLGDAGFSLVKETGAGLANANSYADVADGDTYHAGHLYASAWTAASADNKAVALVMASRLIDAEYQFGGVKSVDAQALQWPREDCPDPDGEVALPDDAVPKAVVAAACELARELILVDRTASPPGEGLKYYNNTGVQTGYDKTDTRPIIPAVVQALLAKYGALIKAKSGSVKLVRV